MTYPTSEKKIKAWALFENGKPAHYYGLHFIPLTKKQAEAECAVKNQDPLNHKMIIVPCTITYSI